MSKLAVEVKSVSVVKMAGISPTPMARLDLTQCDIRLLNYAYIQRALIFHIPESEYIDQSQIQLILENLKKSLSLSLDFFPPLAGRLAASFHAVDCNNAGIDFTHAVAAAVSISDILELEPNYTPQVLIDSFIPQNGVTNYEGVSEALLAVQVTELGDGGLIIACSANHAVVDGTSFWHFLNSWSEISRGSTTLSKSPIFDRSFPGINKIILRQHPSQNAVVEVVTRHIHFSRERLIELKNKANSEAAGTTTISYLQSLSAHLWRSTVRCRRRIRSSSSHEETTTFIMPVGARERNPNLPDGYFGNAVYVAQTSMSAAELLQKGLGHAAFKINELVARQTEEEVAIRFTADQVTGNYDRRNLGIPFVVTGSPRFDVYGNDFGWGKPIAARIGKSHQLDGIAIVSPSADGGIDVELSFKAEAFHVMEDDADFNID